jgi:nucleotide-binding universal stress UspA family protein
LAADGTPGGDRAAAFFKRLGPAGGGRLSLVHAVSAPPGGLAAGALRTADGSLPLGGRAQTDPDRLARQRPGRPGPGGQAVGRSDGPPAELLLREGFPAETLLDAATARGADVIVMGRRGLSRLDRFFLGSVSRKVAAHADRFGVDRSLTRRPADRPGEVVVNDAVPRVRWFENLRLADVPSVGGKNASLGELTGPLRGRRGAGARGVRHHGRRFLGIHGRGRAPRRHPSPAWTPSTAANNPCKKRARPCASLLRAAPLPANRLQSELRAAHAELARRAGARRLSVAVRSSATAEDLPEASFAGQHESYLNIVGEEALLRAVRDCFASLFTDRAISYREQKGFDHLKIALSVGVQRMVRSDRACAGVMFTLDPGDGVPAHCRHRRGLGIGGEHRPGRLHPGRVHRLQAPARRSGGAADPGPVPGTQGKENGVRPRGRSHPKNRSHHGAGARRLDV